MVTLGLAGQSVWPNQCVSGQGEAPEVDLSPLYVHHAFTHNGSICTNILSQRYLVSRWWLRLLLTKHGRLEAFCVSSRKDISDKD